MNRLMLLVLMMLSAGSSLAGTKPMPTPADARVKVVTYSPNEVVELTGHFGRTIHVRFAEYEQVTDIALGDSEAWIVARASAGNALLIKPSRANASTNAVVVTDKRTYNFALDAKGEVDEYGVPKLPEVNSKDMTYSVRFIYPDDERAALEAKAKAEAQQLAPAVPVDAINFRYSYSGSLETKPLRVFDDGTFTYFVFPKGAPVPAVFAVDADGNEAVLNFHVRGEYQVVERMEAQFTLRSGKYVTCIFNDARHAAGGKTTKRTPL